MGLLDLLFNRSYPTSDWPAFDGRELCFDFDKNALCEVAIGDRMERLRFLGPTEDAEKARQECLDYPSKGFYIDHDHGRIVGYSLFWQDPREREYASFAGTCLVRGQAVALSRDTTEQRLTELWGKPYWRDEDDEEVLLFYEHGNIEWQAELKRNGGLRVIEIITPPMLADPKQRESYKVTKPWPPVRS